VEVVQMSLNINNGSCANEFKYQQSIQTRWNVILCLHPWEIWILILKCMGVRKKNSRVWGNFNVFLILFEVSDDTIQMDVLKNCFTPSTPQRKCLMLRQETQKCDFIGTNMQVDCDDFHNLSAAEFPDRRS